MPTLALTAVRHSCQAEEPQHIPFSKRLLAAITAAAFLVAAQPADAGGMVKDIIQEGYWSYNYNIIGWSAHVYKGTFVYPRATIIARNDYYMSVQVRYLDGYTEWVYARDVYSDRQTNEAIALEKIGAGILGAVVACIALCGHSAPRQQTTTNSRPSDRCQVNSGDPSCRDPNDVLWQQYNRGNP